MGVNTRRTKSTQRKPKGTDLEGAARASELTFRFLAKSREDMAFIVDLDLRTTYVSPSVINILGFTPEERMQQTPEEQLLPESLKLACEMLSRELEWERQGGEDPDRYVTLVLGYHHKDGSVRYLETNCRAVRDRRGPLAGIYGLARDVTQRLRMEEELRRLAVTDSLTAAYNRRYLQEELHREMSRSDRFSQPFSLIMLDVDHFKTVNDTFGHEVGDRVLKGLVELIQKRIRKTDLLARWGGEEFMIMLVSSTLEQAVALAEELLEKMNDRPFPDIGLVTASFGVTNYRPGETMDQLLTRVDDLMYQAKRDRRGCVRHDVSLTDRQH